MREEEEERGKREMKLMVAWCVLGLASWVQTNGIFQELPEIAKHAPGRCITTLYIRAKKKNTTLKRTNTLHTEGYDLFSYATVLVALSNVFPLCYLYFLKREYIERCERMCIYFGIGCCGAAVCVFLAFLYDHVTTVGDHNTSVAFFVLIFLAGGLDCTTSVVFFPVAQRLSNEKRYVTALMLGEASTGILTSGLSTLQSLNDYKTFTVEIFFVILSIIVIVAVLSFRYIETSMSIEKNISRTSTRTTVTATRTTTTTPSMRLFLGQAALAFVENGLHTTLLPHALSSFPNSARNISIATKLGYAGASVSIICAHCRPLRSKAEWILAYVLVFLTSTWMIVSSAGIYNNKAITQFPYEEGAVTIIVLCKIIIAYTKTALFLYFFRENDVVDDDVLNDDIEIFLLPKDEDNEEDITSSHHMNDDDVTFRWGGAGIQAGGFVGAILFFLLTVPTCVLNN